MRPRLLAAAVLAAGLVLLTGCGGSENDSQNFAPVAVDTPAVPVTSSDDDLSAAALLMSVDSNPVRYPYFSVLPEDRVVKIAGLVCGGFDSHLSFVEVLNAVIGGTGVDPMEAAGFVGAAVGSMCDDYLPLLQEY